MVKWLWVLMVVLCGCQAVEKSEPLRYDSRVDFPIVTHYPEAGGTQADKRRQAPPGWGDYSAVVTDHTAPSRERVLRSVRRWEAAGECAVDVYNAMDRLQSGVARLQVVNNVVIGQSLWTFFVGPNWTRDGGPYVLVVSGRTGPSSNNSTAYGGTGPLALPDGVAKQGMAGFPFVLAFVNQGGRESQGNHPDVLRSVGEGIAFAKAHFNIDDQRVVFAGKSRGGASALMWGANPLGLAYRAAGIFAHAAPTHYGKVCYQPNGTFPQVGSLAANELAGSPDWMVGAEHAEQMRILRDCMAGSQDPDVMRTRSPIGQIEGFRNVYLAVGWGTHDPSVGPGEGFDFCQALDETNIAYYAEFTLGGGHHNSQGVSRAFEMFMQALLRGEKPKALPTGRWWNQAVIEGGEKRFEDVTAGSPVWTLLPRITTAQRDHAVYVGAPDGAEVYLRAEGVDDPVVWVDYETVVEWDYVRVDLPPPPRAGRYRWTVAVGSVELPDSAIVTRDDKGRLLPPETLVLETERPIRELFEKSADARTFGHAWVWPF